MKLLRDIWASGPVPRPCRPDGAEAGARAEAAAGNTAKAARLSQQAARYRQAISLARGGKAGAAAREAQAAAAKKLTAKGQAIRERGRAAVTRQQERRAVGRRDPSDPLAPHTPESLAKAEADEARMHERWQQQGRHTGQGQHPILARAGEAPASKHTKAIGKPDNAMQTAGTGASSSTVPRLKQNGEFEDPALEAKYQRYTRGNPARGRAVRDRLSWKREKERWAASPAARGNDFNSW